MANNITSNHQIIPMKEIIHAGLEELLGESAKDNLLIEMNDTGNHSDSIDYVMNVFQTLEKVYGMQGGRGVAYQMGRSSFLTILQKEGRKIGVLDQECRLLPSKRRIESSFQLLAKAFSEFWYIPVEFETNEQFWEWHTMKGCCYFFMGILQECLAWICGDKFFQLETANLPLQDERFSVIQIGKVPLNS